MSNREKIYLYMMITKLKNGITENHICEFLCDQTREIRSKNPWPFGQEEKILEQSSFLLPTSAACRKSSGNDGSSACSGL